MSEHDERADELEHEADEMEERADRLEDEIGDVRQDWERKKADSRVPGAAGDPEKAEEGPKPETSYPSKGDED
jgi:predicted  nucleic acid-binding Zn-ribbon protein